MVTKKYFREKAGMWCEYWEILDTLRVSKKSYRVKILHMSRSTKKANRSDDIDRISNLPGNVIDGILKHLNISELIGTSILSKKWRFMWMSVPELEFCYNFFNRFRLETARSFHFTITTEYLNMWILFLSRKGIKYLELQNSSPFYIKMPSHIFSCQEMTHFRCSGFKLSVPPNFCGLKNLLDLYLEHNIYEFGALQNFISGCPLLEKLSIELFGDTESVCLKKAKNLIDLRITIYLERVSDLIKSLPKIQRLTIGLYYSKLYPDVIPPTQLISLKYLKLFNVNLNEREVLYIVNVLKSASDLVELDIESRYYVGKHEQDQDQPEEFECNSCCLSQLQTVNIRVGTSLKYAMRLIQFILANFSSLKTLTFEVGKKLDAAVLLGISQDLLRMERASQRARVEFLSNEAQRPKKHVVTNQEKFTDSTHVL
ncbi:F-box/FBD/LRR-repeat protein [Trifolium repens]|nr:F-box/FBD/LRR-repeat protein [Trifolium repens]